GPWPLAPGGFAQKRALECAIVCSLDRLCASEHRGFDSKLEHRMDEADDVVDDDLQQQFVGLSHAGLAAKRVTKYTLYATKCRFGVAAGVVLRQELVAFQVVEMPEPTPCDAVVAPSRRAHVDALGV